MFTDRSEIRHSDYFLIIITDIITIASVFRNLVSFPAPERAPVGSGNETICNL